MARTVAAKVARAPKRGALGRLSDYMGQPVGEKNRKNPDSSYRKAVWPDPSGELNKAGRKPTTVSKGRSSGKKGGK